VALPQSPKPRRELGAVATAALAELEVAGRVGTALGAQALSLANRLDNGLMETGSAYASLSKEFREVMAQATRGAAKATAPEQLRDELAARRAKHGA
jgi:hypothetical protein